MKCIVRTDYVKCIRSQMIYGHFIEHFHRQIYGGVYDPASDFADEDGFRTDVIEAMRRIKVPVLRWPGGCFVSSYHWKKAVGPVRTPSFDKAWRVEDPNSFGTDEFVKLCGKIGCEPYFCTNAGTGTAEEMSDWVEYCNLDCQGEFAAMRISNGCPEPHHVRYWSIGNENYGFWEIGAKGADEWAHLVVEAAKMMKHVDPKIQLSAAALSDTDWNVKLLKAAGEYIDWISIHSYWNLMANENKFATYEQSMAYTKDLEQDIRKVRGLLTAFGLEKRIRIAFDEWNLRGWHHPGVHTIQQADKKEDYIKPRDLNDRNQDYTMADAVFTACFLNTLNRNSDIVGMAGFAPVVNTRGCIYTYDGGVVLRSTYYVFELYVNYLGEEILELYEEYQEHPEYQECQEHPEYQERQEHPDSASPATRRHKIEPMDGTEAGKLKVESMKGEQVLVDTLDLLATHSRKENMLAVAAVNKDPVRPAALCISTASLTGTPESYTQFRIISVNGPSTESYNDINREEVTLKEGMWQQLDKNTATLILEPHSVNVIQIC